MCTISKPKLVYNIPHPQEAFPIPLVGNRNWHQEGLVHSDLGSSNEDMRVVDHSAANFTQWCELDRITKVLSAGIEPKLKTHLHVDKPRGWGTIRHTKSFLKFSGKRTWLHFPQFHLLKNRLEVQNIALWYQRTMHQFMDGIVLMLFAV
jgi:hypothetical protein